jgi:hypothetical protein
VTFELEDRFETRDGSRPEATPLLAEIGRDLPLTAFAVLTSGDAFDGGGAPTGGESAARQYVGACVTLAEHQVGSAERITGDIVRQLSGNAQLSARMQRAKPVQIDVVPAGVAIASLGYPKAIARNASGIFWDCPSWERARLAVRADRLEAEPALVVHEMAHAIHYLGFTKKERQLIYGLLQPSFGSRAAMDEVFAIYSEREFLDSFSSDEKRAPGVYGFTRRQWNENHVFTRFVRKLYWPGKPLAGPKMGGGGGGDWMKGISRR